MTPEIIEPSPRSASVYAKEIPGALLLRSSNQDVILDRASSLSSKPEWVDAEYRQAYAEAAIEQGIAWQIRANREARNLSQTELAKKIGTRQSAVSRLEDPEHGGHTIPTLLKLAHAFDCALSVKF